MALICRLLASVLVSLALPLHAQDPGEGLVDTQAPDIRVLLKPHIETTLSSEIAGKVTRIAVRDSEYFERNQRLLEFGCAVQQAQLNKADAELLQARKKLEANQRLQKFKSISQLEVDVALADVEKARAELAIARARLDMCVIQAPFAGRVVELLVNPYETVTPGQELLRILDDSRLELELFVPSHWLSRLQEGVPFEVRIDETGKTYPAVVTVLGAKVDPVSHSIRLTAEIEGRPAELLAGMSGTAHFQWTR